MDPALKEKLEKFLHHKGVLKELRKLAATGQKSLVVEFERLLEFDVELAKALLDDPTSFLEAADAALTEITKSPGMHFRVSGLPSDQIISIRKIRAEHVGKFIQVGGILTRAGEVRPEIRVAVFECLRCGEQVKRLQIGEFYQEPWICPNPNCGKRGRFRLIVEDSEFCDWQSLRIQERPEELRGGRMPHQLDAIVKDDFVDMAVAGNHVMITGTLHAFQEGLGRRQRRTFRKVLFVNHVEVLHKGAEEAELMSEDEARINELAKDPRISNMIIQSIAPSIHGHEYVKEAIALQLFGCDAVELPDGIRIRGDSHILLTGDPSCLVADERVVLGNGAIVRIGSLGSKHLQPLKQHVLVGQGYRKALATRLHVYRNQPILEIITETRKSIKGTYNHPLLVVEKQKSRKFPCPPVRIWKRLDEIQPGDRVATTPWIPCSITAPVETGWRLLPRRYGPRPRCKLPARLDEKVAAFLGYILGDGWVRRDRIGFIINPEEEDLLSVLSSIVEEKFGLIPKPQPVRWLPFGVKPKKGVQRKYPSRSIEIHNVDLATNLSFLRNKRVPALIMKSGNRVVAEFLAWLFEADGCVFSKGRGRMGIHLKAKDIELLRDVQMLLLRFGIHSRITGNQLVIRRARSILKFSKNIGFRSRKKKTRLDKLVADCQNLDQRRCRGKQLSECVVTVRPAGRADVYDIEVPDGHRFIANGIISHNTAKSQLLKWVALAAPRGLYTSGMKVTGPGLTASAVRDELTGGWALEAGALVIADGGLTSIDEFEKMSDEDAGAMLEAMEQQTISVAKAGIVATLNARTAVCAAANPKLGRFDPYRPIPEQIALSPVILSRFDLAFIMRDEPHEEKDKDLARHILQLHQKPGVVVKSPFDVDTLRKIIIYARKNIHPKFEEDEPLKVIQDFYVNWRATAQREAEPLPVTPRQLEALVRLAKSYARMRLSDKVTVEDAKAAIRLVKTSIEMASYDYVKGVRKVDIDVLMTGRPRSQRERIQRLMDIVKELEEKFEGVATIDEIARLASEEGMSPDFVDFVISQEVERGHLYKPTPDVVKRVVRA